MIQVETILILSDTDVEQHPSHLCRKATSLANTLRRARRHARPPRSRQSVKHRYEIHPPGPPDASPMLRAATLVSAPPAQHGCCGRHDERAAARGNRFPRHHCCRWLFFRCESFVNGCRIGKATQKGEEQRLFAARICNMLPSRRHGCVK